MKGDGWTVDQERVAKRRMDARQRSACCIGRGRDAYEDGTSMPPLPREDARTPRVRKSTCFVQGEEHVVNETRGLRSTWTLHVHGSVSCEVVSFTHGFVTTVDRSDDVGGPTDVGFPPCPPRAVGEGRVPSTRTSACGDGAEEGRV